MNDLPDGCDSISEMLDGFAVLHIAESLSVSIETVSRWKRNREIPPMAQKLVAMLLHKDLGTLDPAWKRWIFRHGELVSPAGETFTPGRVLALDLHRQHAQELKRVKVQMAARIAELEAETAALRAELRARETQIERMMSAGPVRVQLVAIDADGNSVPLCAPVVPIIRVPMEMPREAGNAAHRAA
jgi:hypothetical protein